jgi:hypothetical protein
LRRKGIKATHDDRILGSGEFVEGLLSEADRRQRETLRLREKVQDLRSLARGIGKGEGIGEWELRSGGRRGKVSEVRRLFCQVAVGRMGYPAAEVARFLGVTPSAVVRAAHSEGLPKSERIGKLTQKQHPLFLDSHSLPFYVNMCPEQDLLRITPTSPHRRILQSSSITG